MKKSANFTEKVEHIPQEEAQHNEYTTDYTNDPEAQSQRTSTDVSSKKRRWSLSTGSLRSAGDGDSPHIVSNRKLVWKVCYNNFSLSKLPLTFPQMDLAIMPLACVSFAKNLHLTHSP